MEVCGFGVIIFFVIVLVWGVCDEVWCYFDYCFDCCDVCFVCGVWFCFFDVFGVLCFKDVWGELISIGDGEEW